MGQRFQEMGQKHPKRLFLVQMAREDQQIAYFDVFRPVPEIFDPSVIYRWNQWFFSDFLRWKKFKKSKKNYFISDPLYFQMKGAEARMASNLPKFLPVTQYTNRKKILDEHQEQTKIVFFWCTLTD